MVQVKDGRSKFTPHDIRDYYDRGGRGVDFNSRAHDDDLTGQHVKWLVWTGPAAIDTVISTPLYPDFGGYLTTARANVVAAPTSTFQTDVLLGGTSVFSSGYLEIASGSLFGYHKQVDRKIYFSVDDYFQIQVAAVAAATGPLVVTIGYIPG